MADEDAPATKKDLQELAQQTKNDLRELDERLSEQMRDMQTELLRLSCRGRTPYASSSAN
jgi:hypothetical protein